MVIISIKMPCVESTRIVPMRYLWAQKKLQNRKAQTYISFAAGKGTNENRGRNERECWTHSIESRAVQFTCFEWNRVY